MQQIVVRKSTSAEDFAICVDGMIGCVMTSRRQSIAQEK